MWTLKRNATHIPNWWILTWMKIRNSGKTRKREVSDVVVHNERGRGWINEKVAG